MSKPSNDAADAERLEQAVQKAKEVAADIRQAADDLAVANTVLDSEALRQKNRQESSTNYNTAHYFKPKNNSA